jgi:excisionase family DNA binding protein
MEEVTFLKPKDVAKRLQMNILTIYEYIRNGQLRASKFGRTYRISAQDLELFVANHTINQVNN